MVPTFKEELDSIDEKINNGYEQIILATYRPVFERLVEKAVSHMKKENIPEIQLDDYTDLTFRQNGNFFHKEKGEIGFSIALAQLYQRRVERLFAAADNRGYSGITLQRAMRDAAEDFRKKVAKSIENYI